MMEFFNSRSRIARKEHICEACEQKIQSGEKCQYECGKFEGEFFTRYYHNDCYEVMQDYFNDTYDDDYFTYDYIYDWWLEGHCYQCALWYDNGGECECDMDRKIWCTRYQVKGKNKKGGMNNG